MYGCAVADHLSTFGGGRAIKYGGEEDGAALGVEVEDLRGVRREAEAVLRRPGGDVRSAAAQDGDVESVDAHLEYHFRSVEVPEGGGSECKDGWGGLELEALEGPVAAALDVCGYVGEGDEGAELAAAALELEGGDVVFDAVGVGGEGGGAAEVDVAVGADEAGAGVGEARMLDQQSHRGGGDDGEGGDECSHFLLLDTVRIMSRRNGRGESSRTSEQWLVVGG